MPVCQPINEFMCRSVGMSDVDSWWTRWRSVWSYIGASVVQRAATERCGLRVSADDRARWKAAAIAAGLTLSAWIRSCCEPSRP